MSDIVELLQVPYLDYLRGYVIEDIKAEAAAEILRLRAENEKLQWELGKALDTLVVHDAVCAENEKLRAALKPFNWSSFPVDWEKQPADTMFTLHISVGHLRAAAAALKETGE